MYSGGKDSTYVCGRLRASYYEIACLITISSRNDESYMLHTPNIEIAKLGSSAMEIPIFFGETSGEKEIELEDIKSTIVKAKEVFGFDYLATGAIASQYQKSRIDSIGKDCSLTTLSPIWGHDQASYMRSLVREGYSFMLTSVSCAGLNGSFLGIEITTDLVEKVLELSRKYSFNPAFEGGEAETLVLDCPLYLRKRIRIMDSEISWKGDRGLLKISKAALIDKVISGNTTEFKLLP